MTSRRFCFTWFGEKSPTFNEDRINYLCFQGEKCPKTGTHHWQGYVELKSSFRFVGACKVLWPDSWFKPGSKPRALHGHLSVARGSAEDNKKYCSKPECSIVPFVEFGSPSSQGHRSDLEVAGQMAIDGKWKEIPYGMVIKFGRGLQMLAAIHTKVRPPSMKIVVYWGCPGSGKTYRAKKENPGAFILSKSNTGWWWSEYNGQDTVIIEEFDPDKCKKDTPFFLTWCDKYPTQVQTFGAKMQLLATKFVFTSNFDPYTWFEKSPAWLRRLKDFGSIQHMNVPFEEAYDQWLDSVASFDFKDTL